MENPRITSIEWGILIGQRPRSAGCNARLPVHGPTMRDPIARITTEDGASGFGWSRVTQAQAEALIGKHLNDLISVENGVNDTGRPIEFPLWDLLGQRTGKPVYALAAEHYGMSIPTEQRAPCYDTTLYFDDLHLESHDEAAALIAGEARQGWERGHRAFKLKVGRGALHMPLEAGNARDIAIIREIDEAFTRALRIFAGEMWNQVVPIQVHLEGLVPGFVSFPALLDDVRFNRDDNDGRRLGKFRCVVCGDAVLVGERRRGVVRRWVLNKDRGRVEALLEPSLEQRPAHLARANKQQRAGEAECHALPCVSSIVAASASSADLPAHNTNWKD